jgi:hypothetical protein
VGTLIETESGATYELEPGRIRRLEGSSENTKRRDGHWMTLHTMLPETPIVGRVMVLVLESLVPYGPDDHGTINPHPHTTRTTTPVKRVWDAP